MAVLYFILYLLAFVFFAWSAAAAWVRPERYPWAALVSLGLAAWVLVLVIDSGQALNN
jgi:hypothetical protein